MWLVLEVADFVKRIRQGWIPRPGPCTVVKQFPAPLSDGLSHARPHIVQVDREFIEDNFNLYGLRALVPHYNEALDMILDIERMDEAFSDDRQVPVLLPPLAVNRTRYT